MSQTAEKIDIAIIGGGVIGCAIAARLAGPANTVFLLERHGRLGSETTERNSGVIHAGLYYKSRSLKETLCIEGNELLQQYCHQNDIPYQMLGKFIVASSVPQCQSLDSFWKKLNDLGIRGLQRLSSAQISAKEPELHGMEAIYSANTGIIDQARYVAALSIEAENKGAFLLTSCSVINVVKGGNGYHLETTRGTIEASLVINCAGLSASVISERAGIPVPKTHFCRGDYFRVRGRSPFRSLIYPVKDPANPGLGIHFTLDTGGALRLGPDAEYVDTATYEPRHQKHAQFLEAGRKFLPKLRPEDLEWDYCGIRPKLRSPQDPEEKDFYIRKENDNWINCVGIESPGITASLAVARFVDDLRIGIAPSP